MQLPGPSTKPGAVRRLLLTHLILVLILAGVDAVTGASLERDFRRPPPAARPWVYWFWLNGNITSNGITADLEAMQRVGIGGVLIMEVDQGTPTGAAPFGSNIWRDLFKHVCAESKRLGLEVNMNNDAGWCGSGAPFITPDLAMQKLVWTETNLHGPLAFDAPLAQPTTVSNYYRDVAVLAFPTPSGDAKIPDVDGKAAFAPRHIPVTATFPAVPAAECVRRDQVREISTCLGPNGQLAWDVPEGKWTVLRLGHTPTGKDNHPAPEAGRGLETDKLSKAATRAMFHGLMGKLISDSKHLAGKTLVSTHIDSWETGSQNWTPNFREEFQRLRGYDPLAYLVSVTGRFVESAEVSERFLWDLRQTVSDLVIENYAGEFRRLAHEKGLRLSIEAYDGNPCDDISYAGQADEPMCEFWSWGHNSAYSCLEMASAAHTYGKRILGAEAFTANDGEKWLHHPATIKTLGDWAFCEGINRFVFHRYALQPWRDRSPGMSMGPWGLHYERTQTWWEQSSAWHEYLSRCQFLLRQGLFVADLCFLQPEGSPRRFTPTMPWREGNTPERPRYNFDGCAPEVVYRMKVNEGRLELPDGMSYAVLVLPQVDTMTPRLLARVGELVAAGATVIGPPPIKSPGLSGFPGCDQDVQALASRIWQADAPRHAIWGPQFKTTQKPPVTNELVNAKWIWFKEGNPIAAAPPGERFFRRLITIKEDATIASAKVLLTADNSFELWINGQAVGNGANFKQTYTFAAKQFFKPGVNHVAVRAVNGADDPNPAALIAAVVIQFADGNSLSIYSDERWEAALKAPPDWRNDAGAHESWTAALELGKPGMQPWGELDKEAEPTYVFPKFESIAELLKGRGIPPDFEGDPSLRFIHRRDSARDIYFVANSRTNWLQALCGFRVAGRQPRVWDPETGQIRPAPVYRETNGVTFVSLSFAPAGSLFVVFERGSAASRHFSITDLIRDGRSILPGPSGSILEAPALEISAGQSGKLELLAWTAGTYTIKSDSGRDSSWEIQSLPAPFELSGAWNVSFQAQRGAPGQMQFDHLSDWSQHPNSGVKYFSGTATYTKRFDMPANLCDAEGVRQFLDLGSVAVMAQVTLNGKELGILWKPPYRAEVTGLIKKSGNELRVKVVNLWVNRMIGDELLPEDSDRKDNGTLKTWPEWLQRDEPSPSGRYTFTSWRLWKKDDALQPSGLLGPVKVVPAAVTRISSARARR